MTPDPEALFAQATAAFAVALERTEPVCRDLLIGRSPVRFCFAGAALERAIMRALDHHQAPAHPDPHLELRLFESDDSGLPPPTAYSEFATVLHELPHRRYLQDEVGFTVMMGPDFFYIIRHSDRLAFYWIKSARGFIASERSAPLRSFFQHWARRAGLVLVHGGAVGRKTGGVLLVGKGGSGKSTACLACLGSPLSYLGDDLCLVSIAGEPWIFNLYGTARQESHDLGRFPHLEPWVANRDELETEKALWYVNEVMPGAVLAGCPLRAIVVPRVTPGHVTTISLTSHAAALVALAPSTLFQLPPSPAGALGDLTSIASRVPAYGMDLGPDSSAVPSALSDLLARSGGA